nr:hypothetical protein [uncultured Chitinophaga sp.]
MNNPTSDRMLDQKSNDITLKEVLLRLIDWLRFLWKKKLIIILFGIIGAAIGITKSITDKPDYIGELDFVLQENSASPLSAYMGLASQMGIDLGGKGSSGVFEGDNIMGFLKSRLIVERTLLSPVTVNGETKTLAELYIDFNNLRKGWEKRPDMKNVSFPLSRKRSDFNLQQDSVLNIIQASIVKRHLYVDKTDKNLSFITVRTTTGNEIFSKKFTETLVSAAIAFYIDTRTKNSKDNIQRLQEQADSMEILLNRKTYSTAVIQDLNLNPAKQVAGVKTELAMRDKVVLQTMYAEIVKNLEMTKISMVQETPVIQIIDTPILPLTRKKLGLIKGAVIGGAGLGFLCAAFLLIRKMIRDVLAS